MSKKGKLGFLGGALVGVGLGVLFAPKSGEETRKELKVQLSNLWDKVRSMDADEIKKEHGVGTVEPVVLRESAGTDVLVDVPSHFSEWPCVILPVLRVALWFIEQDQQVPVAILVPVSSGTRAIQVERRAFGEYSSGYLLDVVDDLLTFHTSFCC